ncbi:MAG: hypothetical protein ABMA26_19995, partial [Limisphaerales bacterium]
MIAEIKALSAEKKQHLIAVGMGTAMALAALWFLLISPAQEALKKLGTQITEAEKKYTDADRLVKRTQAVHDDYDRLNDHLSAIEAGMAASGELVQWIRSVELKFRTQAPYKVEIPNLPFRGQGEMTMIPEFPYKAATYSFSGTAYYHDLGKYLADWENQFPYMRVLSLD